MCEYLIVGVNSDQLVMEYKKKQTIIKQDERAKIVSAIKGVDEVYIVNTLDKLELYNSLKYDAIFIGDDWKGNERWIKTQSDLKQVGVDVVFLPHTEGISTTKIANNFMEK